jgi:2-polyprenyl-3-methyl-5-hydroxy-6-metoxy-1,4-benzoquinol methylase
MSAFNKTHLSIDQAEERGFIHRDYIAHCLRWTYAAKILNRGGMYKTARILDIGCGKEIPLAKLLYTSKMSPTDGVYVAADLNKFGTPPALKVAVESGKFPLFIKQMFDCSSDTAVKAIKEPKDFNLITCFEVIEHMPPANMMNTLRNIRSLVSDDGTVLISTPNYDVNVGAAQNHPNEMNVELVKHALIRSGLRVENMYGTFASIRDYEQFLSPAEQEIFKKLRAYYDTNYLATIFAPLFPTHSRNVLYVCKPGKIIKGAFKYDDNLSNNADWKEILK